MRKYFVLILWMMVTLGSSYSIVDDVDLGDVYNSGGDDVYSSHQSVETMMDWDSGLYGKPICTRIPSNMSLCVDMNYERMKVPNLLGHDTVEEVPSLFAGLIYLLLNRLYV